jgi:hypothetical protein
MVRTSESGHQKSIFASGPVISTFAKVPAGDVVQMLESDHLSRLFTAFLIVFPVD